MNSLDLTKDPEIVPSEVTETVETVDTVDTVETSLETVVIEQPEETNTIVADYAASSKQELIDALKLLIDKEVDAAKDGVEQIKQLFYKKVKLDVEEQKKLFIENGGIETDFVSAKDELEESFKALLNEFRAKKASVMAQSEKEKDSNLLQKQQNFEYKISYYKTGSDSSIEFKFSPITNCFASSKGKYWLI